ncbi:MAG: hypothetical protein EA351_00655 [Gemmatimonadales bacterium]|nr:MAG: hypothetical protein EA351_00655 [Gemmatimonadales bacterium]
MAGVAIERIGVTALHDAGFFGEGQLVALCDTGLDLGDSANLHPTLSHAPIEAVSYRPSRRWDDPHGHGTHLAGCLVGRGDGPEGPWSGSAPGAGLYLQSTYRSHSQPFGNRPPRIEGLLRTAWAAGARIHAHGWAERSGGGVYSMAAREIDRVAAELPELLIVVAVGNEGRYAGPGDGPAPGTLRSPSTARNALCVGAGKNHRPEHSRPFREFFEARQGGSGHAVIHTLPPPLLDDGWSLGPDAVAPFSGRGPTQDGRIKPDLIAPGTALLASRSRHPSCIFPTEWGASSDPHLALLGGTSGAVPLVAGAAAIARQVLIDEMGVSAPSSALLRAVLLNGADLLHGARVPNWNQGWGRLNLAGSLARAPDRSLRVFEEELREGDRFRIDLPMRDDGGPARITLAWTDPPGERLMSDLDLEVRGDDGVLRGNQPAGDAEFDRRNPQERVIVDRPGRELEVVVRAHRLDAGPQRFALAVAGPLA